MNYDQPWIILAEAEEVPGTGREKSDGSQSRECGGSGLEGEAQTHSGNISPPCLRLAGETKEIQMLGYKF